MIDDISKDTVVENMTAQNDSLKKECERLRSQVRVWGKVSQCGLCYIVLLPAYM
mgnify:CR=1 FL=1